LVTEPFSFDLNIQPPNPMFVSPPEELTRQNPAGTSKLDTDFVPLQQELEIIIEFPDGLPRQITSSTLFVDGSPVARNQSAPFNKFTWDLSRYLTSGTHQLKVEATDDLGLVGSSIEVPIKIIVRRTPKSVWMVLEENALLILGSLAALGLALLFLGLIISGKLRPRLALQGSAAAARGRTFWRGIRRTKEPVLPAQLEISSTQQTGHHLPGWINRLQKPPKLPASKSSASFLPLQDSEQGELNQPIVLTMEQMKIGRDPGQVDYFLDDPCIDPIHTMVKKEAATFRIFDLGSTAGTWVNYEPVETDGRLLEHGDIIHVGRIGFRFSMRDTAKVHKVLVTPQEQQP
jgi:hypothetical protein